MERLFPEMRRGANLAHRAAINHSGQKTGGSLFADDPFISIMPH